MKARSCLRRTLSAATLFFLTLTACASMPDSVTKQNTTLIKKELAALQRQLNQIDDEGYQGGLNRSDVVLAQALAQQAFVSGINKDSCPHPRELTEEIFAKYRDPKTKNNNPSHPVLQLLNTYLINGNRKQRDIAYYAIAEIGPQAAFTDKYLNSRAQGSGWSRKAMSAVSCQPWAPNDVFKMWSLQRQAELNNLPPQAAQKRAVTFMVEQLQDTQHVYPDEIFSYSLENRGIGDALTLQAIKPLLVVLTGEQYSIGVKKEALRFINILEQGANLFEAALWKLYRSENSELSYDAAKTLLKLRSQYAADVIADYLESENYGNMPWLGSENCIVLPDSKRLKSALLKAMHHEDHEDYATVIHLVSCFGIQEAEPMLARQLQSKSWSQQIFILKALSQMPAVSSEMKRQLKEIATNHWSKRVRKSAKTALSDSQQDNASSDAGRPESVTDGGFFACFSRCTHDHGLPVCHEESSGEGYYQVDGQTPFHVSWTVAEVNDIPPGFPITLNELREREGYGSNTFLRLDDGWLFGVDLWHYDGDFGFVNDQGKRQDITEHYAIPAFILDTPQLGTVALVRSFSYPVPSGSVARLTRAHDGQWHYEELLQLPSDAYGYAFAPDGTLLVRDPYGAVAITSDLEIVPLQCASTGDK